MKNETLACDREKTAPKVDMLLDFVGLSHPVEAMAGASLAGDSPLTSLRS